MSKESNWKNTGNITSTHNAIAVSLSLDSLPDTNSISIKITSSVDIIAVSYTHLDVYKRQEMFIVERPSCVATFLPQRGQYIVFGVYTIKSSFLCKRKSTGDFSTMLL